MNGHDIRPCGTDAATIAAVTALLCEVFPKAGFTEDFIRWQYAENPDGRVTGFNAFERGSLIAHYAAMPIVAEVNGREERGLLSLNTATHPGHAGRGLFTRLAEATYAHAADNGHGFVVGVANAASTPGFVRKLGFQHLGMLRVLVGVGRPCGRRSEECRFQRIWDEGRLRWRLSNPNSAYRHRTVREGVSDIIASSGHPMVSAVLGSFHHGMLPESLSAGTSVLSLHIGLDPDWRGFQPLHINIPMRFRPSPLNLIFRDLTGRGRTLDARMVRFRAIDFDAY